MDSTEATVFIIDDDPDVREALSRLLRSAGLRGQSYGAAQDFLAEAPKDALGCILLDVGMPGMNGLELHEVLSERGVGLPVIYLTGQSSVRTSVRAMKQGALDFLEKPIDADSLLALIDTAVSRCRQIYSQRTRKGEIDRRLVSLSLREREVLQHVISGRLNKQIAGDLGIALKTVKVHRGRVMKKMHVRSVAELVGLCDEIGMGHHVEGVTG